MSLLIRFPLVFCFIASACASSSWMSPILSLAEEDQHGYNESFPYTPPANSFVGKRIGFIASHCFEEVELQMPMSFFAQGGASVHVLAPWWIPNAQVASCDFCRAKNWFQATYNFTAAQQVQWDALVVVGGVWSSTVVRNDGDALTLLQKQLKSGNLLATVCSGSSVLINLKLPASTSVTGSPAIRADLEAYGFRYLDQSVVTNNNLLTGRSPQNQDNQEFTAAIGAWLATH